MNTLIDENGFLNIEDLLLNNPSFLAMTADKVVTKEEKIEQSNRIIFILKEMEHSFTHEQVELVRKLLAEVTALIVACQSYPEEL